MSIINCERQWTKVGECRVSYRQWGKEGKPVVLLHGIPTNSSLWKNTGLLLSAHGYKVYAPEMLGLGYTEGPLAHDHSLAGQAKLFSGFINTMIQDDYILIGHDLGGGVAQILMTEPSRLLKKCVLTNCVAFDSWPVEGVNFLIRAAKRSNGSKMFTPEFTASFLKKGLSDGLVDSKRITDELISDIQEGLTGTTERIEHFIEFLRAMNNKYTQSAAEKFKSFRVPTMVLWGKQDRYQPIEVGERLKDNLSNAIWKTFDGGHFHALENNILAEAVIEWDSNN